MSDTTHPPSLPARREESGDPDRNLPEGIPVLRSWLRRRSVPESRHSVWYYFGGLTLFLLLVMVGSGILLSTYYEPSASPASAPDGTPLAAARLLVDVRWNDRSYRTGEVIPLPFDATADSLLPPAPLRGAVELVREEITGSPLRPSTAWASVEGRIMHDVEFGPLVRSIHGYSANLLMVALFIHAASAFFMRSNRGRRGFIWTTGAVLLLLLLGFAFTGYLLPWNRLSYFAARVAGSLPEDALPGIGPVLGSILRGGSDVTGLTLSRIYSAHAVALPLATLLFTVLHILLAHIFGLAAPSPSRRRGGVVVASVLGGIALLLLAAAPLLAGRFDPASPLVLIPLTVLPVTFAYLLSAMAASLEQGTTPPEPAASVPYLGNFIYREFLCWLLAFGTIITLAVLSPWGHQGELALPADLTKPLATPEGIHPEWYFMAPYQLLRIMPGLPSALLMILAGIFLFGLPYIDRRTGSRSMAATIIGAALMAAAIALAGIG